MLLGKRTQIFARQTGTVSTAAQTITQKIVMQPRRLVGVRILVGVPVTTAPAITSSHSGIAGFVKEIRVKINDGVSGSRNAVQIKGPALLSFLRQCGCHLDRTEVISTEFE